MSSSTNYEINDVFHAETDEFATHNLMRKLFWNILLFIVKVIVLDVNFTFNIRHTFLYLNNFINFVHLERNNHGYKHIYEYVNV